MILNELQELQGAICFGLREYMKRTGFSKVIIGLSGGIDSALVAALAVEACGPEVRHLSIDAHAI